MMGNKWVERGAGLVIAITLAAGYLYWRGPNHLTIGFEPGKMPRCDSAPIRHLLVKTFEDSPEARRDGLKLIKVGDVRDVVYGADPKSSDPNATERLCLATIFTNGGKDDLGFRISWVDGRKKEIWLEGQ